MEVFKTREFKRFARREGIADAQLLEAVERLESGLIDADLGEGLYKQRVAKPGQGRSRGYRTILACRVGERCVFMYGFAKSGKANLNATEIAAYRRLTAAYLAATDDQIRELVEDGELEEIVE